MATWTNWAATATADVTAETPQSVEQIQAAVLRAAEAGTRIKPVGAGHSFTPIAVTDGVQLRPGRLAGLVSADRESGLVTALAGTRLRDLNEALWNQGLCMTNLGDIDVQTIAGAISTGTHGTGARLGGIATQVRALEMVTADGQLRTVDASDPDTLHAAAVGLGALGVITKVTLQCEPAFALSAHEAPMRLAAVLERLDGPGGLVEGNDHFEFYWFPHTHGTLTKQNNRAPVADGLRPLNRLRRLAEDEVLSNTVFDAINKLTTARPTLIPGANRLATRLLGERRYTDRSYRVFASPRRVRFREMEYAVPRAAVPHVLGEIAAYLQHSGEQVGFPVEVRFAAADDLWLSTAHGRDSGYIAVHQYIRRDHDKYFAAVEAIARSVDGRPHWGKLHARRAATLRGTYPRFDDFVALRDKLDPNRTFSNPYLDRVLG